MHNPSVPNGSVCHLEESIQIVEAVRNGAPLNKQPESGIHFNSLQITFAERFVFSPEENFSVAEKIDQDNSRT